MVSLMKGFTYFGDNLQLKWGVGGLEKWACSQNVTGFGYVVSVISQCAQLLYLLEAGNSFESNILCGCVWVYVHMYCKVSLKQRLPSWDQNFELLYWCPFHCWCKEINKWRCTGPNFLYYYHSALLLHVYDFDTFSLKTFKLLTTHILPLHKDR